MKLLYVVGARPNFMKAAPVIAAVRSVAPQVQQVLVHTGQHFDDAMSGVFFRELGLPKPDEHLAVFGGTHAEQTARIMLAFEPILLRHAPDWVVVFGDVNSTLACALVAAKLGVRIAHVEAGLRSGDMSMPEEVNRRVTDAISDLLFTPSRDADRNLATEGVEPARIRFVGNVMIDSLVQMLPIAARRPTLAELKVQPESYLLVTLHRPFNVDDAVTLGEILRGISRIAGELPVLFPVHPRTRARIDAMGMKHAESIRVLDPLGYLDFLCLMQSSFAVMTDSGGVQEETTYLGKSCLTVRPNTERPVTLSEGTNRLVASRESAIADAWSAIRHETIEVRRVPELWDGRAGERIAQELLN